MASVWYTIWYTSHRRIAVLSRFYKAFGWWRSLRQSVLCVLLVSQAPAVAAQAVDHITMGEMRLEACSPGRVAQVTRGGPAYCGTFEVFENRQASEGRTIGLSVIVVPAAETDPTKKRPPVFPLGGGPGEAARNVAPGAYFTLRPAMETRDLVIVDIRGTGASAPLNCVPGDDAPIQAWIYYIIPFDEAAACARTAFEPRILTSSSPSSIRSMKSTPSR